MAKKKKSTFLRLVAENVLHLAERERLKSMKQCGDKREHSGHPDFLSMAHKEAENMHSHAAEHHGANFWNHYYEGEAPYSILRGDPLPSHESNLSGTHDEKWNKMLDPDSAARPLEVMRNPRMDYAEQISSEQFWLTNMCVADTAARNRDYGLAQHHLLLAKAEAERWGKDNEKLVETNKCLASVNAMLQVQPSSHPTS